MADGRAQYAGELQIKSIHDKYGVHGKCQKNLNNSKKLMFEILGLTKFSKSVLINQSTYIIQRAELYRSHGFGKLLYIILSQTIGNNVSCFGIKLGLANNCFGSIRD